MDTWNPNPVRSNPQLMQSGVSTSLRRLFASFRVDECNGDFATFAKRAHNLDVTDFDPDPPPTLEEAEDRFSAFLASQSYPKTVCWLRQGDVLVDKKRHFWIRVDLGQGAKAAAQRYSQGLERKLGVELRVICATEAQTFATVFVPQDDLDAQYRLIARGLKLSCPVERYPTSTIRNPLKWLALRLRNGRRSKLLEV